ncbi:M28 family peptidase [Brevundimonas diminuta]|uniref:Peptidase M28 domain-containing protein n=1 Tax=Brevundimonas diminuta TaxID=293 RepID=A0A1Z3LVQ1_BREDI|nr:M28 family peptidase [Brevundimonas diminuta]ASD26236.1 hypothetical protein CD943_04625 [Brevundimonas diminuta]
MLRRTFLSTTVAAGLCGPAQARARSGRATALEAHTRFLAHDLLEGRDTGSRGYDIAAAYVASQFAMAGLSPGLEAREWFQPVRVRRRTLVESRIAWVVDGGAHELRNGADVAVDASPLAANETLDLEMVFVGWGISGEASDRDDYAGLDVRGKAVVLLEGAPSDLPGAVRAHYSWIQQKERMASARGAVAVLTLKSPARERVSPWERTRIHRPLPAVGWTGARRPDEAPPVAGTMTLGPDFARRLFAAAGHDIDRIYRESETGRPTGFTLPGRIRLDRRSTHEDGVSANVLGRLPGRDPRLAMQHIVVVSHLDHVGIGPEIDGDRIYNGAVDNAGGIAVMIEAARGLAGRRAPRRSVLFLAVTGEERGLLGSDFYVTHPTVPLDEIVGAISVDGLMAFHDFGGVVALGADHSTLGRSSARAARRIGAVHVPDPIPDRGNLALSDQYPFLRQGVPVLFPNPARGQPRSGPDGLDLWDAYEADAYHQPSDDITLPLRWDVAERWTDYIEATVADAAEQAERPLWYRGDALGDLFSPATPRAIRPGASG